MYIKWIPGRIQQTVIMNQFGHFQWKCLPRALPKVYCLTQKEERKVILAKVHQSKSHKTWILHLALKLRNSVTIPSKLQGLSILHLPNKRDRISFFFNTFHITAHTQHTHHISSRLYQFFQISRRWYLNTSVTIPIMSACHLTLLVSSELEESKAALAHDTHDAYLGAGKMVKNEWWERKNTSSNIEVNLTLKFTSCGLLHETIIWTILRPHHISPEGTF